MAGGFLRGCFPLGKVFAGELLRAKRLARLGRRLVMGNLGRFPIPLPERTRGLGAAAPCVGLDVADPGLFAFDDEVFSVFAECPSAFVFFAQFLELFDAEAGYVVGS